MLKLVASLFIFLIISMLLVSPTAHLAQALDGVSSSIPTSSASINQTPTSGSVSTNVTTTSGTVSTVGTPSTVSPTDISTGASTSVDGVRVFGNGTIITSVNGTSMSFFFDPSGPTQSTTLTVISNDLSGNQITGMWTELHDSTGKTLKTGYTPISFTVTSGTLYVVYVSNWQNIVFNHWDDGSTNPQRNVTPIQSTTLTAYYSTGSTATPPQPPTGLAAAAVSTSQINLSWTAAYNGGSAIIGYKVERSTDNGITWSTVISNTSSTSTTYSDTGLLPSTTYTYRVSAINSIGTSSPSNTASATTFNITTGGTDHTIDKIKSGLVASDPLNNETKTRQQTLADTRYWSYDGSAVAEHAPYDIYKDTLGLHIGVQAQSSGKWAGFFAVTPNTNAAVFHSVIANPVRTIPRDSYENGLYVQTSQPLINYVTCVSLTNNQATVWAIVNTVGNANQATKFTVLWLDNSPNQSLTRDCTIITNGNNYLKVYLDGVMVYSSNNLNLQMPAPFNAYLEPETSYAGKLLYGIYSDYYATSDENIQITNNPPNAAMASIVDSAGNVLASGPVSGGTAKIDVGKYHFPITAYIKVYDSSNTEIASTQNTLSIIGGDVFAVS
jgi:Fibronectin type III domain